MSAPWGSLSNWGAMDWARYQAELDAVVAEGEQAREDELLRRWTAWCDEHAHGNIWISTDGAHCRECGAHFNG